MKKTGIWIDKRMAYIISLDRHGTHLDKVILSKIEDYHIGGGSGGGYKWAPQDVVQDSRYLEREKHQFRAYFHEIVRCLDDSSDIVIFGPAEAGQKLLAELLKTDVLYHSRVRDLIKTDSMTKNQMKAFVRNYFKNNHMHAFT